MIDAAFHFEWLTGSSTKDEQQYVINGVTVDPKLVVNGNAEDSNNIFARVDTSDMDEVTALLGYTPDTPTALFKKFCKRDFCDEVRDFKIPEPEAVAS